MPKTGREFPAISPDRIRGLGEIPGSLGVDADEAADRRLRQDPNKFTRRTPNFQGRNQFRPRPSSLKAGPVVIDAVTFTYAIS